MSDVDKRHADRVLKELLDLSPDARRARIDSLSETDAALASYVERLLAHAEEDDLSLDPDRKTIGDMRAAAASYAASGATDRVGQRIGAFVVKSEIGRGGMGVVYLAERADSSFVQRVALKLISNRWASDEAQRRFEWERRILARLEHPSIARLIDGGVTEEGTPFYAMEFVEGEPLTAYCDERSLGIRDRLSLFLQVAGAVAAAHNNLVIHCDIKPSNVLVDETGRCRLLDFGIAHALSKGSDAADTSRSSDHRVLTPRYASPEQLRGDTVTTASDVFQLGLLLYELLAGSAALRARNVATDDTSGRTDTSIEIAPSRSVISANDSAEIAEARGARPHQLSARLKGDLDAIVMKAIAPSPGDRYAGVSELAADVERFLASQPVLARPQTRGYRLRKMIVRNKAASTALGALFIVLAAASIVTSILFVEARLAAEAARTEALKAKEVSRFLTDMLGSAGPSVAQGKDTTLLRGILDSTSERIEDELSEQPEVEATIRSVLGQTYFDLGDLDESRRHFKEALQIRTDTLGDRHEETLRSLIDLADLDFDEGRYDEAEKLFDRVLAAATESLGVSHEVTLTASGRLANIYYKQLRGDEAMKLYREVAVAQERSLGPEHPDTLRTKHALAIVLRNFGRLGEAEAIHREVLEVQLRILGEEHSATFSSRLSLANIYTASKRFDEADAMYTDMLESLARSHGPEHPISIVTSGNLAHVILEQDRFDEAEQLTLTSLDAARRVLGESHVETIRLETNLGSVYRESHRYEEAEQTYLEALERCRSAFGDEHLMSIRLMEHLLIVYARTGRYSSSAPLQAELHAVLERKLGAEHPDTLVELSHLGSVHKLLGNFDTAEEILLKVVERQARAQGEESRNTLSTKSQLGDLYRRQGRLEEAGEILESVRAARLRLFGEADRSLGWSAYFLGALAAAEGDRAAALRWLREALDRGFTRWEVLVDPDLESLRGDPEFEVMRRQIEAALGVA